MNLANWENKVIETQYTYTMYVGYKEETTEYGKYNSYEVAYFNVSKVNSSLESFKIAPEFQGKGLANQLMALVKELGVDNLMAESYGEGLSQENLIAFYEKHGFKQVVTNGNSTYMTLA